MWEDEFMDGEDFLLKSNEIDIDDNSPDFAFIAWIQPTTNQIIAFVISSLWSAHAAKSFHLDDCCIQFFIHEFSQFIKLRTKKYTSDKILY